MSPYDPYQNTFQESQQPYGQQPYGPTVQHFQDQQQPLPPEPFTQSDLMRLYQLNNALSTAQKEVDDGVLTQEQGFELTKGILGMRAPLIQRQGQAMEWAKKQQLNQVQEANALVQGMQQSDAIYRARGFEDRVAMRVSPLTGEVTEFFEKEPNKWEQIQGNAGPGGAGASKGVAPSPADEAASVRGGTRVSEYFPWEPSPVGADIKIGPDEPVQAAAGAEPGPAMDLPGDPEQERRRAQEMSKADAEMMRWLKSLPDKEGAPGYKTEQGLAMSKEPEQQRQAERNRYDPAYTNPGQHAYQMSHPIFGPSYRQWYQGRQRWLDQNFPAKQEGMDGAADLIPPDRVVDFYRQKVEQQHPWQPPFVPQNEHQNQILWRMYEDHQRKNNDLADYYIRNWMYTNRSKTAIQDREESSKRLIEDRKAAQQELKVKQENVQKRWQHVYDSIRSKDTLKTPEEAAKEADEILKVEQGRFGGATEQGNQSRPNTPNQSPRQPGKADLPEAVVKEVEAIGPIAAAAQEANDFEGARAAVQLQELYLKFPGGYKTLPPEMQALADRLRVRTARYRKGFREVPIANPEVRRPSAETWYGGMGGS